MHFHFKISRHLNLISTRIQAINTRNPPYGDNVYDYGRNADENAWKNAPKNEQENAPENAPENAQRLGNDTNTTEKTKVDTKAKKKVKVKKKSTPENTDTIYTWNLRALDAWSDSYAVYRDPG